MKPIITNILSILNHKEKIKLLKLIVYDCVIGLLDIAFLALLLLVINFYTKSSSATSIPFFQHVFTDQHSLMLITAFLVLFSIKNWLGYLNSGAQHHFFYNVASRLSKANLKAFLKDDYIRFINTDSSVLIRKVSQQPIEFGHYILTNVQQIISQSILILFTLCAILFYHPALIFLLFVLLLPPVVLLGYFIKARLKSLRAHTKEASQRSIQHLQESLAGFTESNIYNKSDFFTDRYFKHQQQLNNNLATQQTLQGLTSRLVEIFAILGFFILLAINKISASSPAVNMLTIGVFMAAAYKIIPGVVKILNSAGQIKTYAFTLTDLQPPVKNVETTYQPSNHISAITFEDVSFQYKDKSLFHFINFEIAPGNMIGISGNSGKGKTTIINLLLGFLQQTSGQISINNLATTCNERQNYWERISYVKQQAFFINDTILNNITLSNGEYDTIKLHDVVTFCRIDDLTQYPDDVNQIIKENGKNISGGQRQRIMLARALYHDFDLLILDEAFAEMDDASEKSILGKLQLLAESGKMIILITHNQSSLSYCNKVISLDMAYA